MVMQALTSSDPEDEATARRELLARIKAAVSSCKDCTAEALASTGTVSAPPIEAKDAERQAEIKQTSTEHEAIEAALAAETAAATQSKRVQCASLTQEATGLKEENGATHTETVAIHASIEERLKRIGKLDDDFASLLEEEAWMGGPAVDLEGLKSDQRSQKEATKELQNELQSLEEACAVQARVFASRETHLGVTAQAQGLIAMLEVSGNAPQQEDGADQPWLSIEALLSTLEDKRAGGA